MLEWIDAIRIFATDNANILQNIGWILVGAVLEPMVAFIGGGFARGIKSVLNKRARDRMSREMEQIRDLHQVEVLNTDPEPYSPGSIQLTELNKSFGSSPDRVGSLA